MNPIQRMVLVHRLQRRSASRDPKRPRTRSPDGERVAFQSSRDGSQKSVYVMKKDGAGVIRIPNDNANDGAPVWSPDGERLAFRSDRGGTDNIYTVSPNDGSNLKRVTNAGVNHNPRAG